MNLVSVLHGRACMNFTQYLKGLFSEISPPYDPSKNYTKEWSTLAINDLGVLRMQLAIHGHPHFYADNAKLFITHGVRSHPHVEGIIARHSPPRLLHFMNQKIGVGQMPPPLLQAPNFYRPQFSGHLPHQHSSLY